MFSLQFGIVSCCVCQCVWYHFGALFLFSLQFAHDNLVLLSCFCTVVHRLCRALFSLQFAISTHIYSRLVSSSATPSTCSTPSTPATWPLTCTLPFRSASRTFQTRRPLAKRTRHIRCFLLILSTWARMVRRLF